LYSDEGLSPFPQQTEKITGINRLNKEGDVPKMYLGPGFDRCSRSMDLWALIFQDPTLRLKEYGRLLRHYGRLGFTTYFPTIITSDFNRNEKELCCSGPSTKRSGNR